MAQENANQRRKRRLRFNLKKLASGKPRLSVFRSNKYIYAQIIDDSNGVTVASASSLEKELKGSIKGNTANKAAAAHVGKAIAERAKKAKVDIVVFDRGSYLYHGRVKELADAAREAGLKF